MTAASPQKAGRKAQARSRVTNDSKLLPGVDGRSVWARRMRDLIDLYSADLGGYDGLTEMQRSMVRRAAALTTELERAELGFANAGEAEAPALGAYQTTANSLRRILESLGLARPANAPKPKMKDITPEPDDGVRVRPMSAGDTHPSRDFDLGRRLLFMIERAIRDGKNLPSDLATMAVELGLAAYADGDLTGAITEPASPPISEDPDQSTQQQGEPAVVIGGNL